MIAYTGEGPDVGAIDQGHLHPLHRASKTDAFQSEIEPGTALQANTAKSHSNGVINSYSESQLVLLH